MASIVGTMSGERKSTLNQVNRASSCYLSIDDLKTYYFNNGTFTRAVDGISLVVPKGGKVGIAGESGSGKTQTALSVLGLIQGMPGIVGGEITVDGVNILSGLDDFCHWEKREDGLLIRKEISDWNKRMESNLVSIRGKKITMVFQEARSALVPFYSIADQFDEVAKREYQNEPRNRRTAIITDLLQNLKFDNIHQILPKFPHELSGGQCQRVMLALALLARPQLIIADEPTTSQDAATQRQILELLETETQDPDRALLLISHNLALLSYLVDSVYIFFAGKVVEKGPMSAVLAGRGEELHPYTQLLVDSASAAELKTDLLPAEEKTTLNGCIYYSRCPVKERFSVAGRRRCLNENPPMFQVGKGHQIACWKVES